MTGPRGLHLLKGDDAVAIHVVPGRSVVDASRAMIRRCDGVGGMTNAMDGGQWNGVYNGHIIDVVGGYTRSTI